MKRLALLFTFLSLMVTASAQKTDLESIDFVKKFYKAVLGHKKSKVIKCMDKEYRTKQIAFLGGNKQQFVDELFGGYDIESNEFVNVKLNEIENIEIQDVNEMSENLWEYVFHVKTSEHIVKVSLNLKKSGKKFGFVGAVG